MQDDPYAGRIAPPQAAAAADLCPKPVVLVHAAEQPGAAAREPERWDRPGARPLRLLAAQCLRARAPRGAGSPQPVMTQSSGRARGRRCEITHPAPDYA